MPRFERVWLLVGWLLLACISLLLALGGGNVGIVGGSVLVALACMPAVVRLRTDPLDLPGIYAAMSVVCFGLLSLLWLGSPARPAPGVDLDDVSDALLLVALGLVAFSLGARALGPAVARPPLRFSAAGAVPSAVIASLFALAITATAAGLAVGALGYSAEATERSESLLAVSQVFVQLSGLGSLIVLVCALQAFGAGDATARRMLPFFLAIQVVAGFVGGFKGLSLLPVVFTGLAYVACTGRVPWRGLVVVAVLTLAVLLPANIAYRSVLRDSGANRSAGAILEETAAAMSLRFRLIDHVALIRDRTPDVYPYGNGSRYAELPAIVLVPRALWPEKPQLDQGMRFSHTYWERPVSQRTSTPITQPGDLLRNFRLVGVPLGLALWGVVIAGFGVLCRRWRSPRAELVLIASLATWVGFVEKTIPDIIIAESRSLPVTIALAWLLLPGRSGPAGFHTVTDGWHRISERVFRSGRPAVRSPGSGL